MRFDAVSNAVSFDAVAFRNTDGGQVVVVKATAGGSFSIDGLQAGTYSIQYTTSSETATDLPDDVTITSGGRLDTAIPAAGVLTVFARPGGQVSAPVATATPEPTATPISSSVAIMLSVGTGQAALGDTVSISIDLDQLPTGLTGFDMDIEIVDPAIAIITGVNFHTNFPLISENLKADGSSVRIIGVDLGDPGMIGPGATNVNLGTLRVRGLVEGVTNIRVLSLNKMDDDDGNAITALLSSGSIQVLNSPPAVNAGLDAVVALGDVFVGTGSINDPGDSAWSGTVDYGDGTVVTLNTILGTAFSLSHTYQNAGLYVVTVSISDDNGDFGTDTLQVDVTKVYPVLPGLTDPARDLNGDGLAEDINGNGRLDFDDIVKLFQNINSQAVTDNSSDFDFNGNGFVDMDDIVQLFMMLVSKFG